MGVVLLPRLGALDTCAEPCLTSSSEVEIILRFRGDEPPFSFFSAGVDLEFDMIRGILMTNDNIYTNRLLVKAKFEVSLSSKDHDDVCVWGFIWDMNYEEKKNALPLIDALS